MAAVKNNRNLDDTCAVKLRQVDDLRARQIAVFPEGRNASLQPFPIHEKSSLTVRHAHAEDHPA